MTNEQREKLLDILQRMAAYAEKIGMTNESQIFTRQYAGYKSGELTKKKIEDPAMDARSKIGLKVGIQANRGMPGFEELAKEFSALKRELSEALFPPAPGKPVETNVAGLAGNTESTIVVGDVASANEIAQKSIEAVQRFSAAVFKGDIDGAYTMCAAELQGWMSPKRFVTEIEKANKQFDGPAVQCGIERITVIYADEAARELGNKDGNWPNETPKPNKRAIVGAFWYTRPGEDHGRWIMLWVTEESGGYRIAKFQQYVQ